MVLQGCIWDQAGYEARKAFLTDGDGDGVTEQDGDCDDQDDGVFPGARETCDGYDQDCDGDVDEDPLNALIWYLDGDGDGIGGEASSGCAPPDDAVSTGGDCDDGDPGIPGVEVAYDGVDQDCDGSDLVDVDGDGYGGGKGGEDCDDADDAVFPGAEETWENGVTDNDCDGEREEVILEYGYSAWTGATPGSQLGRRVGLLSESYGTAPGKIVASAPFDDTAFPAGGAIYVLGSETQSDVSGTAALVGGGEDWYLTVEARVFVDVDGDAVEDIIVSAPGKEGGRGEAWVVPADALGGGAIPIDVSAATFVTSEVGTYLGAGSTALDDVTGDGVADIFVGSPLASPGGMDSAGIISVFSGAAEGTVDVADADITIGGSYAGAYLGNLVEPAGDEDHDGYEDFLVTTSGRIVATILPGGGGAPTLEADWVAQVSAEDDGLVRAARMIGDVDGDGTNDLGVLDTDILIFAALPLAPLRSTFDSTAIVEMGGGLTYFYDIVNLGDLDGDGRSETMLPAQYFDAVGGSWASIFFGDQFDFGSTLAFESATLAAVCVRPTAAFGYRAAAGEDVDGDGQLDIVLAGYSDDESGADAGAVVAVPVPR